MKSIGSIWRKCDLHIHTPASFHWKGQKFKDQTEEECQATYKAIVEKMEALDIDAFCIMDYWTFDGYFAVRKFINRGPTSLTKRLFPGIELRMEAPTHFRLNTHVLFDDSLHEEALANFLSCLRIGSNPGKPPSRQNLIELGRSYDAGKLSQHGFTQADKADDEEMHKLGLMTVLITRESLEHAINQVGRDNCLLIQPYDTSDGLEKLDWKDHPFADSYIMKMADMFETRSQPNIDLFLGLGLPGKPDVGGAFINNLGGYPKPPVSGSDAHSIEQYGVFPSNRITWLKAQPTFSGLRQVCHEPAMRCFIGEVPEKQQHIVLNPTKYIHSINIQKIANSSTPDKWFDGTDLQLNPGLVAIIGNKGTGKSALADVLALAGNTHRQELEFLTSKRFRKSQNLARSFVATLTWGDDKSAEVQLDQDPDLDKPERVRYLPQQFIESLCTEIVVGGGSFERELKKVIFSQIPLDRRLKKDSLDDLLDYVVGSHRKAILQLWGKLHTLNTEILKAEGELSADAIKSNRTALSLKQEELAAHEKSQPLDITEPSATGQTPAEAQSAALLKEAQDRNLEIVAQIEPLITERTALVSKSALLSRLLGHLDNIASTFADFTSEVSSEFADAGFVFDEIVKLTVNRSRVEADATIAANRLADIAGALNGEAAKKGLSAQLVARKEEIARLQTELGSRQRAYQAFLSARKLWEERKAALIGTASVPGTIEYISARIRYAEQDLPNELATLKKQRLDLARDIHKELSAIRKVYEEYYKPVQDMVVATSAFTKEPLELNFDAFLSPARFGDEFLDFIHRRRVGSFYGDIESWKAVEGLLADKDFNNENDAISFIEDVFATLTSVDRGATKENLSVQSQLREKKNPLDLYDFLFGLRYLEPKYALKLGNKDIDQLSSGEKGALLLVFYLLLDPEEIPIIIDQPEQNLDNESVVKLLVDCIRQARKKRQVILVTHNPNLAVVCDADQLICCSLDKADGNQIHYESGAIEDFPINRVAVDVLEGTFPAFDNRRRKYQKQNPLASAAI